MGREPVSRRLGRLLQLPNLRDAAVADGLQPDLRHERTAPWPGDLVDSTGMATAPVTLGRVGVRLLPVARSMRDWVRLSAGGGTRTNLGAGPDVAGPALDVSN